MNFEQVLKALLAELAQTRIRYAVMGGFALGALGVPRATGDLDFLVHRDDLERLHSVLTQRGYHRAISTENVSHYRHLSDSWGSIDVLHAFRAVSVGMLERAHPTPIFGGTARMNVLQPEDIIGLKVQALINDPSRRSHEMADIETLMAAYGSRLDWLRIQEYYELFELGEDGRRLREKFSHAQ